MKTTISLSTLTLLLLCQGFNFAHAQGTIINETFYSDALQENRWLKIYLPEGYDPEDTTTSYPLVIFLHGGYVSQHSYPMLFDALDDLTWTGAGDPPEGYIHPLILVAPDGNADLFGGLTWWSDSEVNGDFERYVHEDVIDYMDSAYNSSGTLANRAIMGHSMGGYGAVTIAMRNLDRFIAVSTFGGVVELTITLEGITPWILEENGGSGPFNPAAGVWTEILHSFSAAFSPDLNQNPYPVNLPIENDGSVIDSVWTRWQLENPPHIAYFLPESDLGIYLHCGLQDELWIDTNRAFRDSLLALGIPCRLDEFEGDHNNQLGERMTLSLQYFDSLFVHQELVSPTDRGAQPPSFVLHGNFPNPFNPTTTIEFALSCPQEISLEVFNLSGERVGVISGRMYPAGTHQVTFDTATGSGYTASHQIGSLPSGIYIYRMTADGNTVSRKMMLIR
jgi:S-formylglutathione hydrolase FrmB